MSKNLITIDRASYIRSRCYKVFYNQNNIPILDLLGTKIKDSKSFGNAASNGLSTPAAKLQIRLALKKYFIKYESSQSESESENSLDN